MGLPWTRVVESTWPIAATLGSRFSIQLGASSRRGAVTRWGDHGRFALSPDGFIYAVDGGDLPEHGPDRARILKLTGTGEIVAAFGTFGNYDGQFVWPHCVAVASDGSVYVGDVATGRRIQKFVP